jgi:hypothetical protein
MKKGWRWMRSGILAVMLTTGCLATAQDVVRPEIKPVQFFVGFQPGLSFTQFDEYGKLAWDVNIIPLSVVYAIDRHWALRIHSIWDLEFRPYNYPAALTTVGVEVALPYYLALKNSEEGHRAFYFGPVLTPTYNTENHFYSIGLGAEAGFSLLFGNKWSLSIAAQGGARIQKSSDNPFYRIVPYSIPVLSLGIWL